MPSWWDQIGPHHHLPAVWGPSKICNRDTLEQKVGQVIQADNGSITPAEVKQYRLGSILSGGNSAPGPKPYADTKTWLSKADEFYNASIDPEGVEVATDISKYLDFVILIFFVFGVAFEVPVATFLLVAIGVTTPDDLVKKRPYIIVGAFVIGMVLTPPDIISQTLLAVPMWILFEIGVVLSRRFLANKIAETEETGLQVMQSNASENVVSGFTKANDKSSD